MKNKIVVFLVAVLLTISGAFAQLRKIPAEVTEAFKNKYPAATEVSWSDKLTSFQANFTLNNEKLEADFSSKGAWKKTTKDLDIASLPASVAEGFKGSKYSPDWTIKSANETEKEDKTFEYRLFIEKSALQKKYVYMNRDGKVLREAVTL